MKFGAITIARESKRKKDDGKQYYNETQRTI